MYKTGETVLVQGWHGGGWDCSPKMKLPDRVKYIDGEWNKARILRLKSPSSCNWIEIRIQGIAWWLNVKQIKKYKSSIQELVQERLTSGH